METFLLIEKYIMKLESNIQKEKASNILNGMCMANIELF